MDSNSLDVCGRKCSLDRLERLAQDCLGKHNVEAAIFYYRFLVYLANPNSKRYRSYVFSLCNALFLNKDYVRVVQILKQYGLTEDDPRAKYLAAQSLFLTDEYEACIKMLDSQNSSNDLQYVYEQGADLSIQSTMFYLKGQVYLKLENIKEARENFGKAFVADPYNYQAFQMLYSKRLYSHKQLAKSVENVAISIRPEDSYLLEYYQLLLQQGKHQQNQLDCAEQTPTANNSCEQQKMSLQQSCMVDKENQQQDDSRKNQEKKRLQVISLQSLYQTPLFMHSKAEILYLRGLQQSAYKLTKQLLQNDKLDTSILPLHITLAYHKADVSQLQYYQTLLMINYPDLAVTFYTLGCLQILENNQESAVQMFGRAFNLRGSFPEVALLMAEAYELQRDDENAVQAYRKGIKNFPGCHKLYIRLAALYLKRQVATEAQLYLLQVKDTLGEVDDPELYLELGRLHFKQEQYAHAGKDFRRGLHISETFSFADDIRWRLLYNLGLTLYQEDKIADSHQVLKAALSLSPANVQVLFALSVVALCDGRIRDAFRFGNSAQVAADDTYAYARYNEWLLQAEHQVRDSFGCYAEQMDMGQDIQDFQPTQAEWRKGLHDLLIDSPDIIDIFGKYLVCTGRKEYDR